jgi:hypothetical protein
MTGSTWEQRHPQGVGVTGPARAARSHVQAVGHAAKRRKAPARIAVLRGLGRTDKEFDITKATRICVECKATYPVNGRHSRCWSCRKARQVIPCPICGVTTIMPNYTRCYKCVPRGGENNPSWKNARTRTAKGYVLVSDNGRTVLEHRHVMEQHLGRPLLPEENVHHLNGIREDNRIENLELWRRPQPSGIRASDAVNWALEVLRTYAPEHLVEHELTQ